MNEDKIKGTIDDAAGHVKRKVGEWTGDTGKQVEGAAQQLKGKAEKAVGNLRDALKPGVRGRHNRSRYRRDRSRSQVIQVPSSIQLREAVPTPPILFRRTILTLPAHRRFVGGIPLEQGVQFHALPVPNPAPGLLNPCIEAIDIDNGRCGPFPHHPALAQVRCVFRRNSGSLDDRRFTIGDIPLARSSARPPKSSGFSL